MTDEDLEELADEATKLVKLLADREVGMATWWEFLHIRLDRIDDIKSRLGL